MIPRTTIQTQYYSYGSDSSANMDVAALGKNDFLTLLIAELQNQDPLNPADNTEFIAQLAQFSSLEQLTTMNATLEKTLESNTSMTESVSNAMIINYFGKKVTAETDAFFFNGDDQVELQFNLDSAASWGNLEITDESGNVVESASLDVLDGGINAVVWNGVTNHDVKAEPGIYRYTVEAYDVLGNEIGVSQLYTGIVQGISYKDGETRLDVGGILVPFNSIKVIVENE